MSDPFTITDFTRHNIHLHALLLENQPWFCTRELGRLMGFNLSDRVVSKLDEDQRRTLLISYSGQPEQRLLLSESGA
jgi:prophage antirepressor-like protein